MSPLYLARAKKNLGKTKLVIFVIHPKRVKQSLQQNGKGMFTSYLNIYTKWSIIENILLRLPSLQLLFHKSYEAVERDQENVHFVL